MLLYHSTHSTLKPHKTQTRQVIAAVCVFSAVGRKKKKKHSAITEQEGASRFIMTFWHNLKEHLRSSRKTRIKGTAPRDCCSALSAAKASTTQPQNKCRTKIQQPLLNGTAVWLMHILVQLSGCTNSFQHNNLHTNDYIETGQGTQNIHCISVCYGQISYRV